ncbi:MAG: hypothetical protein HY556_05735 [Euryarchaeota archaeon]|nr:hypothetical protein [Euryarchaeota archaeon]
MAELDVATVANVATAGAVAVAVFFGALQWRQFRSQQRDRATLGVMESFQRPEFLKAHTVVWSIPDGADGPAIRAMGPSVEEAVQSISHVYEVIGVMVYRRMASLEIVQDLMGGAIVMDWRRLRAYVEMLRVEQHRPNAMEWFQWLAEQLERRKPAYKETGAHTAFRDWRP